jgi:regulator of replication initiation timing
MNETPTTAEERAEVAEETLLWGARNEPEALIRRFQQSIARLTAERDEYRAGAQMLMDENAALATERDVLQTRVRELEEGMKSAMRNASWADVDALLPEGEGR